MAFRPRPPRSIQQQIQILKRTPRYRTVTATPATTTTTSTSITEEQYQSAQKALTFFQRVSDKTINELLKRNFQKIMDSLQKIIDKYEQQQSPETTKQDAQEIQATLYVQMREVQRSGQETYQLEGETVTKQELLRRIKTAQKQTDKYIGQIQAYEREARAIRRLHIDPTTGEPLWDEIPDKEKKYYPNANEYFNSLSVDEKLALIGGNDAIQKWITKYQDKWYHNPTFKAKVDKKWAEIRDSGKYSLEESFAQAIANVLWDEYTIIDPDDAFYEKLHPIEQALLSFYIAGEQTVLGVIALPIVIAEALEGIGAPISVPEEAIKLKEGIGNYISSQRVGPSGAMGAITTGVTYHAAKALGMSNAEMEAAFEEEREKQQKYPWQWIPATLGEVAAGYLVAKGTHIGLTAFKRALIRSYVPLQARFPTLPSLEILRSYKPSTLIKKGIAKIRDRVQVSEYQYLAPEEYRTPSGLVKSAGPEQTIQWFKESGDEWVHATGQRWRSGKLYPSEIGAGQRAGEPSGLFVSPKGYGQPRFLRIDDAGTLPSYKSKISFVPKIKRPALITGSLDDVRGLPTSLQKNIPAAIEYIESAPKSTATITPKHYAGGFEPEAVIPRQYRITIKPPSGQYEYFMYKGEFVPVDYQLLLGAESYSQLPATTKASQYLYNIFTYSEGPTQITPIKPYLPSTFYSYKPTIQSYPSAPYSKTTYPSYKGYDLRLPGGKGYSLVKPSSYEPPKPSKVSYTATSPYKQYPYPSYYTPYTTKYPYKPSYTGPYYGGYPAYGKAYPAYGKAYPPAPLVTKKKRIEKEKKIEQGYDTYAKKHATKKPHYIKLNKTPLLHDEALGLGAEAVDNSVSRTFYIKKSKNPPISQPNYANMWKSKQNKFRKPIRKGKPIKSDRYIEKTQYAIDTQGEFKGITVQGWKAKQLKAQQLKTTTTVKKKKTKQSKPTISTFTIKPLKISESNKYFNLIGGR